MIERALAVADAPVSLDKVKVIVLMVLWCQQADIDVLVLEELLDDGEDRRCISLSGREQRAVFAGWPAANLRASPI